MTILHISDTHGKHVGLGYLPVADVLVHSGDFTLNGSDEEALDFLEWFCDLPYKHKIFIAGNHDGCMIDASLKGLPENVHYLNNSGVTIDGVSFYGVPMLAEVVDGEIRHLERYDLIDENVDVLVTHNITFGFPYFVIGDSENLTPRQTKIMNAIYEQDGTSIHKFTASK